MLQLSEEMSSGEARLRVDVYGSSPVEHVLDEMTFLNYRLASVKIESEVNSDVPHVVWQMDAAEKDVWLEDGTLFLDGEWYQGEVQKVIVSMLALQMEKRGLHPFHASGIRYRDQTIMFLGGESNHGKTMSQIEGCRRGAHVISTETLVTDERGWAVMGSKTVFLRQRSKGTERSDLPDQDEGVAKFFDKTPEFLNYEEERDVDLVIVPDIDGNYDTQVVEMIPFEREYQTYHCLMNYIGLNQLLSPGLPTPIIDTPELRLGRAAFCHRFAERPYFLIRAKTPQLLLDEIEPLL